ncbi:S41 family peptidase [Chitinophaga polysaccharea]|uniref:S41 family peptidase n=1 Tax=Chitinophaga polysaccharea TaxID=1293035 RepID=UPI00145530B8|nr:S41 family peptidase [Chitinophaga polysaccharea]NLR59350.1 S41 family peptidase [Chitinophaga polysaccharea]
MMLLKKYVLVTLGLAGFSLSLQAQVNPKEKLWQTLKAIQGNYVDSLTDETLVNAAIAGMMGELDPHSRYFSSEEAAQMQEAMKGNFAGIGIQFMMQHDSLYVTQVVSGGPADKAGLQAGDRITAIDKAAVTGATNFAIMKKIRGEKGTPVALEILRKSNGDKFTAEIVRDIVADRSVKSAYMVNDKVGYISLRLFSETTRNEIDKALMQLKSQGMKSLILDLQGNGGGLVQAAIGVADEFLPKDKLVFYSVGKDKGKDYYYTGGFGNFMEGNLVVLIDQYTASASEILTGALQDWDRAVIVGRRSFGKGLMQHPVPVFDGSVLELTGARYYTPSGRSIQKPYHGNHYTDNVQTRLASGELMHASVVHFPDSLKYTTLTNKRTVFGGGGIMPDKFIPIDTVEYNGWLQEVSDHNLAGKITFDYLDSNRAALLSSYHDFKTFNQQYTVPDYLVQQVVGAAEKAGLQLQPGSKNRIISLLSLELKGQLASQLFAGNDYYLQVLNTDNASFQEALQLLQQPERYAQELNPAPAKKGKK